MPTTITIDMPDISGEAGPFSLFLRKRSDNTLLNTGGDTLTEIVVATVNSGVWSASIAETIPAEDCFARVYEGTTETAANIVGRGILYNGQTEVGKEPAAVGLTGPFTRTITVTDTDTNDPIEGARVRLYRTGETETVETNASGVASFTVAASTWSYAITASGYTGVSGTVVVSANGDTAVEMEAVSTTPPTNPDLSAIVVLCLDAAGQPEANVDIDIRITAIPSGSQNIAYKGAKQTATSDADGIARFEVVQGSTCEWKRGRADVWSSVVIDSDDVTNVTSVIGSP